MKQLKLFMMLMLCMIGMASCSDDNGDGEITYPLTIQFELPEKYNNSNISSVDITLTELNSQKSFTKTNVKTDGLLATVNVPIGYYKMNAKAKMNYNDEEGKSGSTDIIAYKEGITVSDAPQSISTQMFFDENKNSMGFVLAEIFCAGSANQTGNYYYADKYFVIYNNTDHVLYADSLVIAESEFMTTMKENYSPDIMDTDMAVGAMYMIPGTGHDVPVQPGGKLLIVDNAVNHTIANPNSWDFTGADFEWYDESTNPQITDVNNPNVPNLVKIYSNSVTVWSPHTQGFKSYALARMHASKKEFLSDYMYDYSYHIVGLTGEADMTGSSYRLPNSWILDAVNMSTKAGFQWIVTSPALDRGFTYNSDFNFDDSRFGKSVRRKVTSMVGERAILQDTNNSTDDFEPRVKADPFHVWKK